MDCGKSAGRVSAGWRTQMVHLVPELCVVHPLRQSAFLAARLLPRLLWWLHQLLLAADAVATFGPTEPAAMYAQSAYEDFLCVAAHTAQNKTLLSVIYCNDRHKLYRCRSASYCLSGLMKLHVLHTLQHFHKQTKLIVWLAITAALTHLHVRLCV